MIDHVSIGVRNVVKAKRFYDAALNPLGYTCVSQGKGSLGYGSEAVALWITAAERPVPTDQKSGLHFCFTAPTRKSVDAFHAAALKSGGRDTMTILKKTICAVLAAATIGGSMVGSTTTAEARGGAFAAGIIGGVALGAMAAQAYAPTTVYVAERRYVRRHRCGCVVHYHVYR